MKEEYGTKWKIIHSLHLIAIFIPIFGVIGFFRRKSASAQNRWLIVAWIYVVMDIIGCIVTYAKTGSGFMNFFTIFYLATIVYACVTLPSYLRAVIARKESAAPANATASSAPTADQINFDISHKEPKEQPEMPLETEMKRIHQINDALKDQTIYLQLCEIETICGQILDYISKSSDNDNDARTFTSYYLPEYLKLMENYIELCQTPVKTEKITKTMEQIQNSIPTTLISFKNLYNNLYSEKASDISNSVDVFEKMMSQDGLTEDHASDDSIHLKI